MKQLTIIYSRLPPTSNKIYFRGTILTSAARKYAEDFSLEVVRKYLPEISEINRKGVFSLHLKFFFETLINESYFSNKKNKAKTLYKRTDLTNRVKLLEDCVRDALAIDDCQTFHASLEKHHAPGNERVEITITEIDPSYFNVPVWP